ncbi:MAG: MarC family protein [Verrucomicrobiota bacterium]
MQNTQEMLSTFILLWAVIDPIGTIPVFIAATQDRSPSEQRKIALLAAGAAAGILLFFVIVGEVLLQAMGVPLLAFQIAGGLVLFLFALTMIFGESKPEGEVKLTRSVSDTAIFPLSTPSIASPGAMMAVVLLTENSHHSIPHQMITSALVLLVVGISCLLMLAAGKISKVIGSGGASIISRVMGLILASIAATHVLEGLKEYFQTTP